MKHIQLETPIEEMDDASLRATFADVMAAHEDNVSEFSTVETETEALEAELTEARAQVEQAKAYFAEKAAEVTSLDTDILAERFSLEELTEMAGRADQAALEAVTEAAEADVDETDDAEFSEDEAGEEAETDEDENASVFASRPPRAPEISGDAELDAEARSRISGLPGLALD